MAPCRGILEGHLLPAVCCLCLTIQLCCCHSPPLPFGKGCGSLPLPHLPSTSVCYGCWLCHCPTSLLRSYCLPCKHSCLHSPAPPAHPSALPLLHRLIAFLCHLPLPPFLTLVVEEVGRRCWEEGDGRTCCFLRIACARLQKSCACLANVPLLAPAPCLVYQHAQPTTV